MKYFKKLAAAGLVLAMTLALTACGGGGVNSMDATALVKGNLDEIYLGIFDPKFLEDVNSTENEAEQIYLDGLEAEASYFFSYYSFGDSYTYVSDEQMQAAIDLYKEIYAKSKYTVQPATKQSDGTFAVKVVFEPVDIHVQVSDMLEDFFNEFLTQYEDVDTEGMTDDEYDAWMAETVYPAFNQAILDLVESKVPDIGYGEENSTVIQVVQDKDGAYTMDQTGFDTFDMLLVTYP